MADRRPHDRQVETARRRGYLILFACAAAVHVALAILEWPKGNWTASIGGVVCVGLLAAVLVPRVSTHQLDQLLAKVADLGAVTTALTLWPAHERLSLQVSLSFVIMFVLWFGLLPMRAAITRSALLYLVIGALVFRHSSTEYMGVIYLGFLALLVGQMTFTGRQIRQERQETARYADLALTDPLTGLDNRRAMYTHLQEHYALRLGGHQVRAVGVVLADIDHFKAVNDTYGHETGDQVLRHVGGVLRSCVRPGDQVSRWGGEEFLLMVEAGDLEVLEQICKRILATLSSIHSGLPPVTLSLGVALASEAEDVNALLRLADRRLYRAKRAGRNQVNLDPLGVKTTLLEGQGGLRV